MTARAIRSARLILRGTGTAPGVSLFVVLVVALLAAGGAAAPGLLREARSATVRAAVNDLAPAARDVSGSVIGVPQTGAGEGTDLPAASAQVWGAPLAALNEVRDSIPEPTRDVLGAPRIVVAAQDAPARTVDQSPRPASRIFLTFDPTWLERVRFVAGAPPSGGGEVVPIALSVEAAAAMAWPVDEVRKLSYLGGMLTVVLSGTFDAVDPGDPEWSHVPTGLRPEIVLDGQANVTAIASAYAPATALRELKPFADQTQTSTWFPLRVERLSGDTAEKIGAQLRRAVGTQYAFPVLLNATIASGLTLRTAAPNALDEGLGRSAAMTAVVAVVAVGPLAVAAVAMVLTARMLAVRRVRAVRLARARGAAPLLVALLLAGEGLALGTIGSLIGAAVGSALTAGSGWAPITVPLAAAVIPAVVVPVSAMIAARRADRADLGRPGSETGRRRLVLEIGLLLIAAAVIAVVITRDRGAAEIDPLLVLVPLSLAAIGSICALRLVPLLLQAVEAGVAARRGLVALVGPARARRDPVVRSAPVLAVVVGLAVVVFSVAFFETVRTGIDASAEAQVGADVRLEAPYIRDAQLEDLRGIPGVRATAALYGSSRVDGAAEGRRIPLVVYVVATADVSAVQSDLASRLPMPPASTPADDDAVPVVASTDLIAVLNGAALTIGDTAVDIVAAAPTASPWGAAESWVLVDRSLADRLLRFRPAPTVVLIALDDAADPAQVRGSALAAVGAGVSASAITPAQVSQRLYVEPALTAVRIALAASIGSVLVLLALTVVMTLVLGASTRGRMLALLAALGYPRRRELPLVAWEVGPALLVALPVGLAAGLVLPYLVVPSLDLTFFVGGERQPPIELGGWLIVAVVAGFVALGVAAIAVAALLASRVGAAATLRAVDQEAR